MRIAVLPGDGIGPEVTGAAQQLMRALAPMYDAVFDFTELPIGGTSIDQHGMPLVPEVLDECRAADAVLLGAVGGPKWDSTDPEAPRPEQGLLGLRKGLELFANLRPVRVTDALLDASPLRPERVRGADLLIVRELTGGLYFGERGHDENGAFDTLSYSVDAIRRILHQGFRLARSRHGHLTSVDKANVLDTSRLWHRLADEIAAEYPDV
jgi:3-isopropylmalate dehydrogenase